MKANKHCQVDIQRTMHCIARCDGHLTSQAHFIGQQREKRNIVLCDRLIKAAFVVTHWTLHHNQWQL